ncbi:MAG: lipid IV(A) 3-deoxy-D-manno-octulosonic acid transferase [Pseudomonadota bacterium]|nr:lipid IV(A) 3-deoxy-D-manno-octulosonic acid transferase [Pseudomonadota bacterium]
MLYGTALQLLLPVLLARQWWRGRQLPEFRAHWRERLGRYAQPALPAVSAAAGASPQRIWVHAVSLGETQASLPLLRALQARWPHAELVLSHMTPTGRAAGAGFGLAGLHQAYLPYDAPGAMARFLDHFRPQLGLLMETEVWPGLVGAAQARGCPLVLVNARLSARSLRGYRRLGGFARAVFAGLAACCAQTEADAQRLRELGAGPVAVCGNLKFDMGMPAGEDALAAQFRAWWGERPVWLAASTREGEEALLLDAVARLDARSLLLLVPRHPQRFEDVAALVQARGLPLARRSASQAVAPPCRVVLGDSLGELGAYYRSAALAFVGGSLLPLGGQNLLEACVRGCPVLLGPHTFNFADAAAQAVDCGAALRVADSEGLAQAVSALLADAPRRARMGEAGRAFVARHRGATARSLAVIEAVWARSARPL